MRWIEVNVRSDPETAKVLMQVDMTMLHLTIAEARQIALELNAHAELLASVIELVEGE